MPDTPTLLMPRRQFMLSVAALIFAPAVVRASSLMPVRAVAPYSLIFDGYITQESPIIDNNGLPSKILRAVYTMDEDGDGTWSIIQLQERENDNAIRFN